MNEERPKRQRNPNAPPRCSKWLDRAGVEHDSPKAAKTADARAEVERCLKSVGEASDDGRRLVFATDLLDSDAAMALFEALRVYVRLTTEKSK